GIRDFHVTGVQTCALPISLPGRFQRIECETEWILDVAHNPAAASVLGRSLRSLAARRPCVAVCGVLGDKDLDNIYRELADVLDRSEERRVGKEGRLRWAAS